MEESLTFIREDLQRYYAVVSYPEKTMKCKLAGKDGCRKDGVRDIFKFCPHRGWANFVRHLKRGHKLSPDELDLKGRKRNVVHPPAMMVISRESSVCIGGDSADADGSNGADYVHVVVETEWKNLKSKEDYCVVCHNACTHVSDSHDDIVTEEQLKRLFPGGGECSKLREHLFYIFFIRKIIEFPSEKCEIFLRECKGRRTPETWFSLCSTCREIVLQAAEINNQLVTLQREFENIRKLVKLKFLKDVDENDLNHFLTSTGKEIRRHLKEQEADKCRERPHTKSKLKNAKDFHPDTADTFSDDDQELGSCDIKVEPEDVNEEDICTTIPENETFSSRGRKLCPRIYNEYMKEENNSEPENVVNAGVKETRNIQRWRVPKSRPLTSMKAKANPGTAVLSKTHCHDADVSSNSEHGDKGYELPQSSVESDHGSEVTNISVRKSSKTRRTLNKSAKNIISKRVFLKTKEQNALSRSKNQRYCCHICPSKYRIYGSLREHFKAHEISKAQNNKYDCKICGYPCHTEYSSVFHFNRKYPAEGGLPCSLCHYLSHGKKDLARHLHVHKEEAERERLEGKFLCKLCNKLFVTYVVFCKHKRTVHYKELGLIPNRCDHCSVIYSSQKSLRTHIKFAHENEFRYFCEICGKGMNCPNKLRRHIEGVHLKDRRFVCEICGADYCYRFTLSEHMKREHSQVVLTGAGSGTTKNNFIGASSNAMRDKNFTCKHCNAELASSALLRRHIKNTHTELYAYKCNLCTRSYGSSQNLRRHKEINHTTNVIPCQFCGKEFPHRECLRTHYKYCKNYTGAKKLNKIDGESITNFNQEDPSHSSAGNDAMETSMTSTGREVLIQSHIFEASCHANE